MANKEDAQEEEKDEKENKRNTKPKILFVALLDHTQSALRTHAHNVSIACMVENECYLLLLLLILLSSSLSSLPSLFLLLLRFYPLMLLECLFIYLCWVCVDPSLITLFTYY